MISAPQLLLNRDPASPFGVTRLREHVSAWRQINKLPVLALPFRHADLPQRLTSLPCENERGVFLGTLVLYSQ